LSATGTAPIAPHIASSDSELTEFARAGDDLAFEELYRRYRGRISAFVRRYLRDEARAEDVTQDAFLSALRRMRATDSEIAFKPWIYEIARNAAIDVHRRTSRSEEISIDAVERLRASDRRRLVGSAAPESALITRERLDHLRGALDELSDTHHRIIVMRELEGLSYREIGERMELTRPAVESTLFRARRRLEREFEELDTGRRCAAMVPVIARLAEGIESAADARRLRRHARRCAICRRRARELGVEPIGRGRLRARAAALLPLPGVVRGRLEREAAYGGAATGAEHAAPLGGLLGSGGQTVTAFFERAAALVTAAALAGAGTVALEGGDASLRQSVKPPAEHRAAPPPAPGLRGATKDETAAAAAVASGLRAERTSRPARKRSAGQRRPDGSRRGGTAGRAGSAGASPRAVPVPQLPSPPQVPPVGQAQGSSGGAGLPGAALPQSSGPAATYAAPTPPAASVPSLTQASVAVPPAVDAATLLASAS
jgi:RNA polymerase sigma factor (sigma-70 family)